MRLPVAATDTTPTGFTWTRDGELVMVAFTCDRDKRDPDMGCGCGRAFAGLDSHRATTRAVVRDLPIDFSEVQDAVRHSLTEGGWIKPAEVMSPDDAEFVADICAEMIEIGELFGEGTILARCLDDVFPVQR